MPWANPLTQAVLAKATQSYMGPQNEPNVASDGFSDTSSSVSGVTSDGFADVSDPQYIYSKDNYRARYDKGQDQWYYSQGTQMNDGVMAWGLDKEANYDNLSKSGFNYTDQGEYADFDILAEGIFDFNPNKSSEEIFAESNTIDANNPIQNTGAEASVNANEASMSSPNNMMDTAYSNEGTTVNPSQVEGQNIANANKNLINQQNQQQNNKFEFKWHTPQYSNFM